MKKKKLLVVDSGHPFIHDLISSFLGEDYDITWIDYTSVRKGLQKEQTELESSNQKKCLEWYRNNNAQFDTLLGVGAPNRPLLPYFTSAHPKTTIIYFPYDIIAFLPRSPFWILERRAERRCFTLAHKILHKGFEKELEMLPYAHKLAGKPQHLFRAFIRKNLITKKAASKLSDKDGELHLVYGGGWYYKKNAAAESFFDLYKPFVANGVHVHIHTRTVNEEQNKMMKAFSEANPYFHYEGELPHAELVKKYPVYDYGLNFYATDLRKLTAFDKTAFSNKIFDYLTAGLPVLALDKSEGMCEFIEANDLGLSASSQEFYLDAKPLIEKLKDKARYKQMQTSVKHYVESSKASEGFRSFVLA